jgi:calcium/calmodulin-dependent protein kinase I
MTRARLRRGIELVKLANRIEALKMQEDDPENSDLPTDATLAADQSRQGFPSLNAPAPSSGKRQLSKAIKGAIFREVVLAKVREMKQQEQTQKVTAEKEAEARKTGLI